MKKPFVSFCTVAMNRIGNIRDTLPVNLRENKSPFTQFLLLDYNSQDGLGEYIKNNFQDELADGSLVYYNYRAADSFHRSHSRNMAFKLAAGEIVCNIDADNYAGPAFATYIKNLFSERSNLCLTGVQNSWKHDACGKLCVSKNNFLKVTGYDENFAGYGFEDYDLVNRLQLSGCETFTINKPEYLRSIDHHHLERLTNEELYKKVNGVFVHYIDADSSILLFLMKDGNFISAKVVNNYTKEAASFSSSENPESRRPHFKIENGWNGGKWEMAGGRLSLIREIVTEVCVKENKQNQISFKSEDSEYYEVNETMKMEALFFYSETVNRERMLKNLSSRKITVNQVFGNGIVFKNFQDEPIKIMN